MKTKLDRLIELNSDLNNHIQFDYYDDERESSVAKKLAIAGGLVTAGAGLGAAYKHRAVIGQHASRVGGVAKEVGRSAVSVGRDYSGLRAGELGAGTGVSRGKAAKISIQRLIQSLKGIRYSSREERLIVLNSKISNLIKLDK